MYGMQNHGAREFSSLPPDKTLCCAISYHIRLLHCLIARSLRHFENGKKSLKEKQPSENTAILLCEQSELNSGSYSRNISAFTLLRRQSAHFLSYCTFEKHFFLFLINSHVFETWSGMKPSNSHAVSRQDQILKWSSWTQVCDPGYISSSKLLQEKPKLMRKLNDHWSHDLRTWTKRLKTETAELRCEPYSVKEAFWISCGEIPQVNPGLRSVHLSSNRRRGIDM